MTKNKECEIDGCVEEAHNKVGGIVQNNNQDTDKIIEVDLCDKHFLEQCETLKWQLKNNVIMNGRQMVLQQSYVVLNVVWKNMIVVLGGKKYNDKTVKELFCRNYLDLRMAKKESVNVN